MAKDNTYKRADTMLSVISGCIEDALKKTTRVSGAIVDSVNGDGTVNVHLPFDDKIFTNIINQTPFDLFPGDGVELMLKNGSFNNCWVIAKHQASAPKKTFVLSKEERDKLIEDILVEVERLIDERLG